MVKLSTLIIIVISIIAIIMSVFFYKEHRANIVLKQQLVAKQTMNENNREIKVLVARANYAKLTRDKESKLAQLVQLNAETRNEQLCLAKAIFYESSNEPTKGKIAVAQVVVQRADHPAYPNNVCDVVYQKLNSTCQFSWHCDPNIHRTKPTAGPAWEESKLIAKQVLVEGVRLPELKGALFFKANYIPTTGFWKSLTLVAQYGGHVFYKR